jgi:hypothetical protein
LPKPFKKNYEKNSYSWSCTCLLAGLSSCKKDYTCTCTVGGTAAGSTTINDTKKNAKEKCDEGDQNVLGIVSDCEIE